MKDEFRKHEDYTRVVFEFDTSAEYDLREQTGVDGSPLRVVNLGVSSRTHEVRSTSPMVESVSVTADGPHSVASIRLHRPEARRRLMLLSAPPRLVIDFYPDFPGPDVSAPPPVHSDATPPPVLAEAAPSAAASPNLEEVRVGSHESYTRVVFELDADAEFGLEEHLAGDGTPLLLVDLEASSPPREIRSSSEMVESVSVEGHGARSVASIRLRHPVARRKQMVLSEPPRVVIDLYTLPDVSAPPPIRAGPTFTEVAPVERARFWPSGHARRELVDVRVEPHDAHALVIFELDGPTGFTIARELEDGDQVFVIALEATASERFIASTSDLVESVLVEEGSPHTTVRIRPREPEITLTEAILSNPPRIAIELRRAQLAADSAPR